ncbi:MAG TPA: AsmA-like C-terminal region-containing protein [Bacteroidales bacterium]|nr:AsmA-like C-terminal region-containing protein [Bacteroidales bacterium]
MKLSRKIVLIIFILFSLSVAVPGIYALLRRDQLAADLIEKFNKTLNTKISYGSINVTIFESFPSITVRFNELLISPSPDYDRSQFDGEGNDTLLYASSLSLAVHLPSLLTGTIAVRSITARDGKLYVLTDDRGKINYELFSPEEKGGGKNLKLNSITARNIKTVYSDKESKLRIAGIIEESNLSGEILGSGIFLTISLTSGISSLDILGKTIYNIPAKAIIRLRKTDNSLSIARGAIDLAGLNFGVDGTVNYSSGTLDMSIEGRKINISDLVARLPEKWKKETAGLNPDGLIDLTCILTGAYGKKGSPHFDVKYSLSRGRLSNLTPGLNVNNLSFSGSMTNGKLNDSRTFVFAVDTLTTSFGQAYFTGSFRLRNLMKPEIHLSLSGDLIFDDLKKLIKTDFLKGQEGSVKGSIKLSGTLPDNARFSASDLPALHPEAKFNFSEFGAGLGTKGMSFSNVNGSVIIKEHLNTDNLKFSYKGQNFSVSTEMQNFIAWLAGRPETMNITGDIHTDRFITTLFTGSENDTTSSEKGGFNIFPRNVLMAVRLTADSIFSKGFTASNFRSNLTYRPYVMTFSNISAMGLGGDLSGELLIGKQNNGSYLSMAKLEVTDIDINDAFRSFNNFGQGFIVSENLRGRLTGNVTILTPLNDNFDITTNALVAEAHLLILNGRLIEFSPTQNLSRFLDIDEMKDIGFSKLENDIFIRNSTVSVPKMLINSSAGNFTAYGSHAFMGDYSYHVRVLLSEVLSRQARDKNRNVAAFEQVNVDGSGKATIPLKIVCEKGLVTVGYDMGQAQDEIKANIAEEKRSLKSILNEEYGWYKGDTVRKTVIENKPKFSITWEEGKEQTARPDTSLEIVTESPLKQLFKKKR